MTQTSPSREADKFVVRLPSGMRPRIAASAQRNHRSMNNEIVHHLAQALGRDEQPTTGEQFGDPTPAADPIETALAGSPRPTA